MAGYVRFYKLQVRDICQSHTDKKVVYTLHEKFLQIKNKHKNK